MHPTIFYIQMSLVVNILLVVLTVVFAIVLRQSTTDDYDDDELPTNGTLHIAIIKEFMNLIYDRLCVQEKQINHFKQVQRQSITELHCRSQN